MTWQRLEGSGISADLRPGLAATVSDALWMLARQWQVGEFAGEDAASPVQMRAEVRWHPVGEVRVGGGAPEPVDTVATLLEARVECEDVQGGPARLRLAAESGRRLLRMLPPGRRDPALLARLQKDFPLRVPADDGLDPRGRAELTLLAARGFDGTALAADLGSGGTPDPAIAAVAPAWLQAVGGLVDEPPPGAAGWDVGRLEYTADVAAPDFASGTVLRARGYPGGHLDWEAFDVAGSAAPELGEDARTATIATVPVPLRYPGMPASRWWEFEDGAVDWGDVQGGPEDLPRYLVAAYACLYGDDWSVLPVPLPRGVLAQVSSVRVSDSFGRSFDVEATAVADDKREGASRAWRFMEQTGDPAPAAGHAPLLLIPAVLPPHERGRPVEEVLFLRDEVANLGWAVERVIEGPSGRRVLREREPAAATGAPPSPPEVEPETQVWGYQLSTPVPAHYVPLVPVTLDNASAAMRLQRGRLATATGTTGARGLILVPDRRLLLHEEEIPGNGIRVTRAYEYARSPDGGIHLWMSRRKRPGSTPRAPGLRHDVVAPTAAEEPG
jgi:hypothetical protein